MTLVEYAEKVSSVPLSEWQKECFQALERAEKGHKTVVIMSGRNIGRTAILKILNDWRKVNGSHMNDSTVVKNEISQEIINKAETIEKSNSSGLGQLNEYRCSCGRLLGKFSGQAEIKCPKCGKMNVIGGI